MTLPIRVPVKFVRDDVRLPQYAHPGDSGMDVGSAVHCVIPPGMVFLVPTGISVAVPDGYEMQVRPRSGLAKKGITVINSPGTVDSPYRGEVGVLLINHSQVPMEINVGDRIAQLVFAPVCKAELEVVEELPQSDRGEGGFGSTGISSFPTKG